VMPVQVEAGGTNSPDKHLLMMSCLVSRVTRV
jgi:hypothetical protein